MRFVAICGRGHTQPMIDDAHGMGTITGPHIKDVTMHVFSNRRSIWRLGLIVLMAATGACSAQSPGSPPAAPTTATEAAKVVDLATFPLVKGAETPQAQTVAGLSYKAPGTVKNVFEFQRKHLSQQNWKELPASYVTDQTASASFTRNGFSLSVMVFPTDQDGTVNITITNHGNIALDKLPVPPGVKPFFGGPVNASYITEAPVEPTAEACRKLLADKGWQPYGAAGDVQFFKQNAVRLAARVSSAPAQGGKTVIDYSAVLMSTDLPAPADAEKLQYTDTPVQLFFDTPTAEQEVAEFYRRALAKAGWEPTTENLIKVDFKKIMIFRNPAQDLLRLEVTDVDGKTRVLLAHLSAAQVAELDRLIQADTEKKKMEKNKPLPKLALTLPADAKDVEQAPTRIEFKLPTGKIKAAVESWRKRFAAEGWKEDVTILEDMAGSISFTQGNQQLTVTYDDTGVLPAEVTIRARGVELERTKQNQ